jgi:hypothetical protein
MGGLLAWPVDDNQRIGKRLACAAAAAASVSAVTACFFAAAASSTLACTVNE